MILRSRKLTALAVAVLAATLLADCGGGSDPVNTGPFGGSNYGGEATCLMPSAPHSVYTDSDLAFTNSGPTAVIDKVSLGQVQGLRLLASYTVPVLGIGGGYGDWAGYPPPQRDLARGVLWNRRQHADGAHVPHTPPKPAEVALVLVLQLTGATGSYATIDIYYHTSDGHYHMHVVRSLTMRTRSSQKCVGPA